MFLVGFLAIIIFSRKLKKTLLGMEPEEIALQNTISSTVLKSVREGVLVTTAKQKIRLLPALNIPMELLKTAAQALVHCAAE